jgi:hypothetical protein
MEDMSPRDHRPFAPECITHRSDPVHSKFACADKPAYAQNRSVRQDFVARRSHSRPFATPFITIPGIEAGL